MTDLRCRRIGGQRPSDRRSKGTWAPFWPTVVPYGQSEPGQIAQTRRPLAVRAYPQDRLRQTYRKVRLGSKAAIPSPPNYHDGGYKAGGLSVFWNYTCTAHGNT